MGKLWYLSPSDQTGNTGINGYGTEEAQMNALLDAITPHLDRCGVRYHRASRDLGIDYRPAESDALGADYYLALHSNAGGGGAAYGPIAFYYAAGKELAEELIWQLQKTGQKSNRYQSVVRNQNLYETRTMKAASCLLEVDFHPGWLLLNLALVLAEIFCIMRLENWVIPVTVLTAIVCAINFREIFSMLNKLVGKFLHRKKE